MKLSYLKFLFLLMPIFLFSDNFQGLDKPNDETLVQEDKTNDIEKKLEEQKKIAEQVVENINNELYLNISFNEKDYDRRINYLLNRININERENNSLAVKRDEIKLLYLQEQRLFLNTLKNIIKAKNSFKDKNYFIKILNNNIKMIENNQNNDFKKSYEEEKNNDNKISNELVKNYLELVKESSQQLYTLRYLKDNISLYRKTNFFIDKFNLQYLISVIDSYSLINSISNITSYYLKFSVGEIVIVLFILLFFKLLVAKIIHYFILFLNYIILKTRKKPEDEDNEEDEEDEEDEKQSLFSYIEESVERPLIIALYLLSIHISLYILVKDTELLNKIVPWLNTIYMGLLTWAMYSVFSSGISNYALHLVEKYPNVRKEMIVFILRIIKVILILLVILFLFTQLGIDVKAIAASLGVGGIAIALASKDTLANFFGSINIMTDNSFSQGDWIVANDVEGTVVDIRMRTTRIRTFDNAMITVPNSELANTHIKNYSKRRIGRRIKMTLGITYESKMEDIVNLKNDIQEMLENHPHIASKKTIIQKKSRRFEATKREDLQGVKRNLLIYIDEYGSSSINILIYCFTRSPDWEDWLTIKEDVIVQIHKLVKKNNCDFAYPTQTIFMKNNN